MTNRTLIKIACNGNALSAKKTKGRSFSITGNADGLGKFNV